LLLTDAARPGLAPAGAPVQGGRQQQQQRQRSVGGTNGALTDAATPRQAFDS